MPRFCACVLSALVLSSTMFCPAAWAQEWVPGSSYDPQIPTIESVLGFAPPARFTTFYETEKLLHRWAESTDRAKLVKYGEDYEGKGLYILIISSPENIANLDRHVSSLGKLADPRLLQGDGNDVDTLIQNTPVSVLISTIDTHEASSVEAMQIIAYQLLAGTDELTREIRQNVLTYIVPVENPTARERYVSWYQTVQSNIPKADPNAVEHNEPWGVSSAGNHYQLDPNRDFVPLTLRESQAKVRLMEKWHPEVALDIHEMGINSTFFMPPYPEPYNSNLPADKLIEWWQTFATGIRHQFDQNGWRYFSYDAFGSPFLGMHTLYTQYYGMIGILFEQAGGGGGLVVERQNGTLLSLRDRISHHVMASMSALKTAVEERQNLHRYFLNFFRSSLNGVPGVSRKQYVFLAGSDPNKTAYFVNSLLNHGIEVQKTLEAFTSQDAMDYFSSDAKEQTFPEGSYVVSLSQPLSRLANAILEKEPYHSIPVFYDISVWALPYMFGIDGYWMDDAVSVQTEPVSQHLELKGSITGGKAGYAYAWPYKGALAAAAAYQLADEGFHLYLYPRTFESGNFSLGPAMIVAPLDENEESIHDRIRQLVEDVPVQVHALDSGHAQKGSDLGAFIMRSIPKPSVAIVTGDGVDTESWGSFYFLFDEMYGIPFTPITIDTLSEADLSRYNTIILPDGGQSLTRRGLYGKPYSWYFRQQGTNQLRNWVEQGGTLITIKGGTAFASAAGLAGQIESSGATEKTPGAIVRVRTDQDTPLTLGYPETFYVLARNTRLFKAGENAQSILSYLDSDNLEVAGFLQDDDNKRIAGSDYLMAESVGRGQVIMFAGDPNLRNQWMHMHQLLFNCILFGSMLN